MLLRLGIAASAMGSLSCVWTQKRLSLGTNLRIYQSCILPIALYRSEAWTLLSADMKRLQAFHMRCQRQFLGLRWQDRIRNTTVTEATGLPLVSDIIDTRRSALFGHMFRLGERTPAHRALKLAVDAHCWCPHPHPGGDLAEGRLQDVDGGTSSGLFSLQDGDLLFRAMVC